MSSRAQCWAPPHASMPIRHACRLAKCSRNFSRLSCKLTISPVSVSIQCSWNTRFAMSMPTTVCFIMDPLVCLEELHVPPNLALRCRRPMRIHLPYSPPYVISVARRRGEASIPFSVLILFAGYYVLVSADDGCDISSHPDRSQKGRASVLLQQRAHKCFQAGCIHLLLTRPLAFAQYALAVNQERERKPPDSAESIHLSCAFHRYGECEAFGKIQNLVFVLIVFDADGNYFQALIVVSLIKLFQNRHFLATWRTPGRPEMHDSHLPQQLV